MITKIKTIHEEEYSDKSKILGILLNTSLLDDWSESFVYIYNPEGRYIFFNTMVDMINYLLYCEDKMKRAYLEEEDFDKYYDENIEGTFSEQLKWF